MKYKILFAVAVIFSLVLCFHPVLAQDAEETKNNFEVKVDLGAHWTDWDKYRGKVGEYEVLDRGILPDVGIDIKGFTNRKFLELQGFYYHEDDLYLSTDIDLNRILREEFSYFRMPHFLEHDPLKNLNAVFRNPAGDPVPPVNEFTDLDAGSEYMIRYSTLKSKTTFRLPFLPGSEVFFDYRKEQRQGHRQAITISKCSSCHVVSQGREIDEYTEDLNPGFKAKFGNEKSGWLTVSYDYLKRRFGETGADPRNSYNPAVHPATGLPVFTSRVQYENDNLPYNVVPSSEKDTHTIKAHGQLPTVATDVFTSYVNSTTKNTHVGNTYDLNSFIGRITNTLVPGLALSGKFRWMDIDNDDVFVQVTEQPPLAGPEAGLTYSEVHPDFNPEFYRKSAMNRKVYETEISAKYRLIKHLTLRGVFVWRSTDRDYYEVEAGETKTDEYTARVGLSFRKAKLYGNINYEHQEIDDPFANPGAACNPSGTNVPGATAFTGLQYFQFYNMRQLTLSNLPDKKDQVSASATWAVSPYVSLSGYYRYINESNDFDWDREAHMPSISLLYSPSRQLNFTLSYLYNYLKTNSLICEPVFTG
ncbi:MAG: MtrB/PioB family outer membrane beta-barrel protein [Nitrospirae bacterium]|nr:MtrB/PioB family outer membrane beta-barrel protein [Nitrospirota bacterium]